MLNPNFQRAEYEYKNPEDQVNDWVRGASIHNLTRDECTPDFSCCQPDLQTDQVIRTAFKNANEAGRKVMLIAFLLRKLVEI